MQSTAKPAAIIAELQLHIATSTAVFHWERMLLSKSYLLGDGWRNVLRWGFLNPGFSVKAMWGCWSA